MNALDMMMLENAIWGTDDWPSSQIKDRPDYAYAFNHTGIISPLELAEALRQASAMGPLEDKGYDK